MELLVTPFTDPVLVFATVMLLILVAPALARKARLPEIIGLIVAGMVVGPYGFGLLARDQSIELLGKVGLLYIMFLAGLEIDLNEVRRNRSHTLIFGMITFTIPLTMGTALGYWVFGMTVPVAILLASMFSSHTLVTFPAVGKLGLTKARSVTTAVGGTIITDTLALLVLAVIVSSSRGDLDPLFWIRLFSLMIVYMLATLFLIPRIGRWFFRRLGTDENVEFVFVMTLTFVTGFLAHLAGLEPIIGAFLAGLTLNSLIPEKSRLMGRIHFSGDAIFIPFFLISVGMLVNLRLLIADVDVWIVIGGMVSIALLSKWMAAHVSGWILKYRRSESRLVYGLSVNQAAATLAAVLIGYDIGLFDDAVITGTIMMIAVTCLAGSVITQRAGRALALEVEHADFDSSTAPNRILVPLSARQGAKELLDVAILLRSPGDHEPLYPLRVVSDGPGVERELADAEKVLAHTVVRAMSAGATVTPLTAVDINVAGGIIRSVRDNRISLVVCGWAPGATRRTHAFGRTIDRVIDQTRQMLLINRLAEPVGSAKRILLCLPPLAERQVGFERLVHTVKTLANEASTALLIVATAETIAQIEGFVRGLRPNVPLVFTAIPVWKELSSHLAPLHKGGDWIVLATARKGEIAWQPTLERLPFRLASEFSRLNVSIVVPSTEPWDAVEVAEAITSPTRIVSGFARERSMFDVKARDTREAVTRMVTSYFGRKSVNADATAQILHRIAQEEPV
ncbi:MAG: cation:proton antiporter, partial [Spirochaetaceae bacterium]